VKNIQLSWITYACTTAYIFFGSILTQFEYQALATETITLKSQIIAYHPYFFPESSKNKDASL
jgi:hypothetical protein